MLMSGWDLSKILIAIKEHGNSQTGQNEQNGQMDVNNFFFFGRHLIFEKKNEICFFIIPIEFIFALIALTLGTSH